MQRAVSLLFGGSNPPRHPFPSPDVHFLCDQVRLVAVVRGHALYIQSTCSPRGQCSSAVRGIRADIRAPIGDGPRPEEASIPRTVPGRRFYCYGVQVPYNTKCKCCSGCYLISRAPRGFLLFLLPFCYMRQTPGQLQGCTHWNYHQCGVCKSASSYGGLTALHARNPNVVCSAHVFGLFLSAPDPTGSLAAEWVAPPVHGSDGEMGERSIPWLWTNTAARRKKNYYRFCMHCYVLHSI